jgi:small-conductance mechanosensitive channel
MLDETIDWYRALRSQPSPDEPSDLFIQNENRQTADEIIRLTFESARADAQMLSTLTAPGQDNRTMAPSQTAASELRNGLQTQQQAIKTEMATDERALQTASKNGGATLKAKISELQGELDLLNSRMDLLNALSEFDNSGNNGDLSANGLTAQINAMAVALPSGGATSITPSSSAAIASNSAPPSSASNSTGNGIAARFGLWDLSATVLSLSERASLLNALDKHTERLQRTFAQVQAPLIIQLKALAARGNALSAQRDTASAVTATGLRGELDETATQFKQISTLLIPLRKVDVLLNQYRSNLRNWHDAMTNEIFEALKSLGVRLCILLAILTAVFSAAEFWRRALLEYVSDSHRQHQLLLLRRIILWSVIAVIVGFAFASELGSVLTFAGLITAGVAVAMQSVLVSIVGYFFLIGKYGIRVGDRVQIGSVTGDVIAVGLVRLYLMELTGPNVLAHTGRVVAFANSIIFQVSSGIFKQIPGVDLSWREIVLPLPAGIDYIAIKQRLSQAVVDVLKDSREELDRQAQELHRGRL